MIKKIRRKIQKTVTLPIKWKYQKMQTIESVSYPLPAELVKRADSIKKKLPSLYRQKKARAYYLQGELDFIEEILYGKTKRKKG